MRREDKAVIIDNLAARLKEANHFYLTDISDLNAEQTSLLRRKCFEKDIELVVVKNTLLKKAMEKTGTDFSELFGELKGSTSIMFTEVGNVPGKLIKEVDAEVADVGSTESVDSFDGLTGGMATAEKAEALVVEGLDAHRDAVDGELL